MDYEVVTLKEKTAAGITARTNNNSPDMGRIIGELWQRFYGGGIYAQIQNKSNHKALGIYSDYAGDEQDDYNVTVACEVDSAGELSPGIITRTIPAGKYARFVVKGHMQQAVQQFWQELWKMDIKRNFLYDFEEYQNEDMENAEIHIYISIIE